MTSHRLMPGLRLVRRDADHLQLGIDPPYAVVLPDHPDVRDLLDKLATGRSPGRLRPVAARALEALAHAGLLLEDDAATLRSARRRFRLVIEADDAATALLWNLLADHEITARRPAGQPDAVLIVTEGEIDRDRLDTLMQRDVPHLVVRNHGDRVMLGPFVVPGLSACLRCVDAHATVRDGRRGLVIAQAVQQEPLVRAEPNPTLRAMALAAAAREVVTFAEQMTPATWSATLEFGSELDLTPTTWSRHPGCGCAWGAALTG